MIEGDRKMRKKEQKIRDKKGKDNNRERER